MSLWMSVALGASPVLSWSPSGVQLIFQRPTRPNTRCAVPSTLPCNEEGGFESMKDVEGRIQRVLDTGAECLGGFYEPNLHSFSVVPGVTSRFSVTSTCFALQAVWAGGEVFKDAVSIGTSGAAGKIRLDEVVNALVEANWRLDDEFQVPVILITLLRFDTHGEVLSKVPTEKLKHAISTLLNNRPKRSRGRAQANSAYCQFWLARAMLELLAPPGGAHRSAIIDRIPHDALPVDASRLLALALTRSAEISYDEMCRQLAFRGAGDVESFDVIRLAYSTASYYAVTTRLAGVSLAGGVDPTDAAGRPVTTIGSTNTKLVEAAVSAIFGEQLINNGLWAAGQPIFIGRQTMSSGQAAFNADPGDAFVFAPDMLGHLLKVLPAPFFRPHLAGLERTLAWVESHRKVDVVSEACESESGQCFGRPLVGWRSNHLSPEGKPLAWCTAQVFRCVVAMQQCVTQLINEDVLAEFGGAPARPADEAAWVRLLDTDVFPRGRTLKSIVQQRMLEPLALEGSRVATSPLRRFDEDPIGAVASLASYSAILFGPPGTAKTTIAEAIALRLGWSFLVIDTSAFLADGLTNVAARITYVFDRLCRLDRTVILFDEIEEFCLDRETPGLGMESRMLTTSMLTKINNLRRGRRSVFFVATNRLRAFDAAVTRPGRFDLQLFVGTPNLDARVDRVHSRLETALGPGDGRVATSAAVFRSFLAEEWERDAMFFNFIESEQLAASAVGLVANGLELSSELLSPLLEAQAAVMVVKGTVRDEYVLSMGLSRI